MAASCYVTFVSFGYQSNIYTSEKLFLFLCRMEMEIERDKRENWEREMEYLEKWKDMELKPPGKLDIPYWTNDFIQHGDDWYSDVP